MDHIILNVHLYFGLCFLVCTLNVWAGHDEMNNSSGIMMRKKKKSTNK